MRNSNNTGGLIKLLTVLLVSCAIVEAGIASYVGVTMQINRRANEEAAARYEEYQEWRQQEHDEPAAIQYIGPVVQVKSGEVVKGSWEPVQPVQRRDPIISEYTAPEIPKGDIPEIDTDLDIKKAEIQPVTTKTSDSGKKDSDVPKTSGGQPSSGASSQQKSTGASGNSAVTRKPPDTPKGSSSGGSASSCNAATAKNADGTYKHDFSGSRVLGTKNSDKYHNSDCIGARKIPPENEVWYSSVSDAVAAGREACGRCYR